MKIFGYLTESVKWLVRIVLSAANKFYWDDCFSRASSLAYTTLFALVPVSAIYFAMSSGFQLGDKNEKIRFLVEKLLPPSSDGSELLLTLQNQVVEYLTNLANGVLELGNVSVIILVFTGIALVNTIESALNTVWRVTSDRSIATKGLLFWSVITLGSLVMTASFYWYGAIGVSIENFLGAYVSWWINLFIPVFTMWLGFTLLYYRLPAANVALRDAALGAVFSAIAFELTKHGFAYYVSISKNYENFYGVLVSVPLFLFWLYLIWIVILFGAEVSYQSGSIKILHGLRKYASELGEIGAILGLRILFVIGNRFQEGKEPPTEAEIVMETSSDPVIVRACLEILADAGLVSYANVKTRTRSLMLSPDKITVKKVITSFHSKYFKKSEWNYENNSSDIGGFLETFCKLSSANKCNVPVQQWTLAELLTSSPSV